MVKALKIFLKQYSKDRYELMCAFNVYDKDHSPMPGDASSGDGRPMEIISSKKALISLGQKISFI